ncbi:hypothetical protein ACF3NA_00515 [Alkanindiges sp. WGS2144]|uniref:hypothetical protein n=1 Tax=Alkanindiges sp. WGS2144 TaxID=3366808 RepID=UPI0037514A80
MKTKQAFLRRYLLGIFTMLALLSGCGGGGSGNNPQDKGNGSGEPSTPVPPLPELSTDDPARTIKLTVDNTVAENGNVLFTLDLSSLVRTEFAFR